MPEKQYVQMGQGQSTTYFEKSGSGLSGVSDPTTLQGLRSGSIAASAENPYTSSFSTQISSPAPAPNPIQAPSLPQPEAPKTQETFFTSLTEQAKLARESVEKSYKTQLDDIDKKMAESQKRYDDLTEKQEMLLETDIEDQLTPFREDLENKERERLYVNENFEANQKLVRELEQLMTEGNAMIAGEKSRFAPRDAVARGAARAMEDVAARAGVINSVLAARNGQIAQAYNLIDRSVGAITADRKDKLAYYSTLFDFYESKKDVEGNKLLNLEKDQKVFLQAQIGLLENDLKQAEENVNYIKQLMVDPESALFMAEAGITLNDSPAEVNRKMSEQSARQEIKDFKNELTAQGYTYVPFPSAGQAVMTFDVGGQTLAFKEPADMLLDRELRRAQISKTLSSGAGGGSGSGGGRVSAGGVSGDVEQAITLALDGIKFPSVTQDKEATAIIGDLVSQGRLEEAKEQLGMYIRNYGSSATQQDVLDAKINSVRALEQIKADLAAFEAAGGNTGVFTGLSEKALNKVGQTVDPALAELANSIALGIIDYRRAVSGAAFTESEGRAYEAVFPSIGKTGTLNQAKINSLINKFNTDEQNFYRQRIGAAKYDAIFNHGGKQEVAHPVQPDQQAVDEAVFDEVVGQPKKGNYFSRLWGAILGK